MKFIESLGCLVVAAIVTYFIGIHSSNVSYLGQVVPVFVFFTIFCALIIVIQWYKNEVIDRGLIALECFFLVGTIGFLANITPIVLLFEKYKTALIYVPLVVVGLLTTFCTQAGFVGIISSDKKAVLYASLQLLFLVLSCALLSLYTDLFVALSLLIIQMYSGHMRRKIAGEKSKSDWSFKW